MNPSNQPVSRPAWGYRCSICSRCFIAFGAAVSRKVLCVCGAVARPESLQRGIYEIGSTEPIDRRPTKPTLSTNQHDIPKPAELGYGEAHGYGPAHGGPTGPGDAPAVGEGRYSIAR